MIYNHIIVRYGEITLKGKNRGQFINQLRKNVKEALRDFPEIKIDARHEQMILTLNGAHGKSVIEKVSKVFGVHALTPAVRISRTDDLQILKDATLDYYKKFENEVGTFKIESKRADKKYPIDSKEISRQLGAHLLINGQPLKVDVREPDMVITVEIRENAIYLYGKTYKAVGGLPVGTSGKAMLMLSGGIDSPVAGHMIMRRGVTVEAVHFESPPFTSEAAKQKVMDISEKFSHINGKFVLHIVPFTEIQKAIHEHMPGSYSITIMRRVMFELCDKIRENQGGLAIVTGENLGQVASQTLESMFTINEVINTPVLRPLISMDKNEIIEISKDIGTYDISIRPFEDCCTIFKPVNPKTKPRREKVHQFEEAFDFTALIEEAIAKTEKIIFSKQTKMDPNSEIDFLL